MMCTEMTRRSFRCLFELMSEVLSHEDFMMKLSNLMIKYIERSYFTDFIDESIDDGSYPFLRLVQPFRFTHCSECGVPFSHGNYNPNTNNHVCNDCNYRISMENLLKAYEGANNCGPKGRW